MDTKKLKLKYNVLLRAIKAAIDEWNPYGLLPDAPCDEFDGESRMIAAEIEDDDSADKIAEVVSKIFSQQFEPQFFRVEDCHDVAAKIRLNIDRSHIK
jgi:hypothetical protein